MNPSLYGYVGIAVAVVVVVVAVVVHRVLAAGSRLPPLPAFGPLPAAELPRYFAVGEPVLAWEAVRGWELNRRPAAPTDPAPIDQAILTPRVLDFCTGRGGRIKLVFNFLVAAILQVQFDPSALPAGFAPPGTGLLRIFTPSGETWMVASAAFAHALNEAIARTRQY